MGGTVNAHRRESTFEDELTTGYSGAMPVSIMTIKLLQDSGYTVYESQAEAYSILVAPQSASNLQVGVDGDAKVMFGDGVLKFGSCKVMND
jgi:hypothetical protein